MRFFCPVLRFIPHEPEKRHSFLNWIIHIIAVHDQKMCHNLELRLYLQGQSNGANISKIYICAIIPYYHVGTRTW